ncbi:MAG: hypothetical protein E6H94_07895 [Chloroflexi bacterium]|nr:MAG: hypothetical protein E6H94_07895 [Chloroflexota bacterium]
MAAHRRRRRVVLRRWRDHGAPRGRAAAARRHGGRRRGRPLGRERGPRAALLGVEDRARDQRHRRGRGRGDFPRLARVRPPERRGAGRRRRSGAAALAGSPPRAPRHRGAGGARGDRGSPPLAHLRHRREHARQRADGRAEAAREGLARRGRSRDRCASRDHAAADGERGALHRRHDAREAARGHRGLAARDRGRGRAALRALVRRAGVPLRDLLARAKPKSTAFDVAFTSVDGYTDSFPIAKAMEARTLVAYLMNGRTIPQDHGYPARILVPNIYGMKNVKWVRKIEVVSYDFLGYWMQQGWSDSAVVNTNTRIDLPGRNARWDGGVLTIAGIAYAGARGISKVEVSTDGGSSWSAASLEPMAGDLSWRRWSFGWTPPKTGSHRLVARSTDGAGNTETPIRRPPFPNGSTGYHEVDVNVQRG